MSAPECRNCGATLPPLRSSGRARKWCSERCRLAAYRARQPEPPAVSRVWFRHCVQCDSQFTARLQQVRLCSPECQKVRTHETRPLSPSYGRDVQTRRARMRKVEREQIDKYVVAERDGWVCGICTGPIDKTLRYPHIRSLSVDHVIPLVLDGPHLYSNVRAAHLDCNVRRGARMDAA